MSSRSLGEGAFVHRDLVPAYLALVACWLSSDATEVFTAREQARAHSSGFIEGVV